MVAQNLKGQVKKAFDWLLSRTKDANQGRAIYHTRPSVGNLYLFQYSAKHAKTLPYWDRNPLMMPIEYYNDGFLGLNFHYLPPMARKRLFDHLKQYTTGQDERKRFEVSYSILSRVASDRRFQPCVKRYLYNHVRSKFAVIPPSEWDMAILIPSHKFVKQSAARVWRESMRK